MKIPLSLGKSLPHFSNSISTQGNLSLNVGAVGLPLIHHLQANLVTAHTLLMLSLQQTSFIPDTPPPPPATSHFLRFLKLGYLMY